MTDLTKGMSLQTAQFKQVVVERKLGGGERLPLL
jgi:hypothetical protein